MVVKLSHQTADRWAFTRPSLTLGTVLGVWKTSMYLLLIIYLGEFFGSIGIQWPCSCCDCAYKVKELNVRMKKMNVLEEAKVDAALTQSYTSTQLMHIQISWQCFPKAWCKVSFVMFQFWCYFWTGRDKSTTRELNDSLTQPPILHQLNPTLKCVTTTS